MCSLPGRSYGFSPLCLLIASSLGPLCLLGPPRTKEEVSRRQRGGKEDPKRKQRGESEEKLPDFLPVFDRYRV